MDEVVVKDTCPKCNSSDNVIMPGEYPPGDCRHISTSPKEYPPCNVGIVSAWCSRCTGWLTSFQDDPIELTESEA